MALELSRLMTTLAAKRPLFHSEADFQHALAWEIQLEVPNARIRLEYRAPRVNPATYLDILVLVGTRSLAIELKYKTMRLHHQHGGEDFDLKSQAAQDLARYDFVRDIVRLERTRGAGVANDCWAVFLTNDPTYWQATKRPDTIDRMFRLNEGRTLKGYLSWPMDAAEGSIKGREAGMVLKGVYPLTWNPYSSVSGGGEFRYLALTP